MAPWDEDSLESALRNEDWFVNKRSIQHATQFELIEGVKVNIYNTGRTTVGGPDSELKARVKDLVDSSQTSPSSTASTTPREPRPTSTEEKRVFVVYGHDTDARRDLELILRRVHVTPIILQNIPGVGDTLIEKLESLTDADFACVLLTPDDIGASGNRPEAMKPRARQNVVLELGMVLSRLGRRRVAIMIKGSELEKPSDIAGLIYLRFEDKVGEVASTLGAALASAGFDIDVRDLLG